LIDILFESFIACILIAIIHTYFGIHILKRGIIFADLSIAQIVALGTAFAVMKELNTFYISLIFGILGAILISLYKFLGDIKIQEALIGITYVSATALSIIFLDKAPHGEEALKTLLSGNLLWVTSKDIIWTFVIYIFIGIIHIFLWKKFWEISKGNSKNILLDFLFFISFALVVTYGVKLSGILLVFSFLIIPALISGLLSENFLKRMMIGSFIGIISGLVGIYISYSMDLPTGPAIVIILTIPLIVCVFFKKNLII
jgi:zinc/manganese transport system permease protein